MLLRGTKLSKILSPLSLLFLISILFLFALHASPWGTQIASAISPPIGPATYAFSINEGAQYTNSLSVTLTPNDDYLSSGGTVPTYMRFSNYDFEETAQYPSWVSYELTYDWDLLGGDGQKTVYGQFKAGSITDVPASTVYTRSIILDTEGPTLLLVGSVPDGEVLDSSTYTLSWNADDGTEGSGLDYFEVSLDGGASVNVGTDTTYTFTGLSDGDHTFSVEAFDKLGNPSSASLTATIEISGEPSSPSPSSPSPSSPSPSSPSPSSPSPSSPSPSSPSPSSPSPSSSGETTLPETGTPLWVLAAAIGGIGAASAVVGYKLLRRPKKKPAAPLELAPVQLRITAEPTEIVADGQTKSVITLQLLDKNGNPISAIADTQVKISAAKGKLEKTAITVPKGKDTEQTAIISSREAGEVPVTAEAESLRSVTITLNFLEKRRYCMHCGALMPAKAKACQNCGKAPPAGVDTKVCHNCKSVIPSVAKFCSECGTGQKEQG